jgi:polyhydroxyalkanoate synthesis regulator phasin
MGQKDILQRSVGVGRDVSQKTQDRVEALLADLVKLSEQQAEQARTVLNDLVDRSRTTSEHVVETVDRELRQQVANLGLATQADIRRLERKIEALGGGKAPTKKAAAKKAPAKKRATKKAAAKKAAGS